MKIHGAADAARLHVVRTPEGVSLPFRVATAGERIHAFMLDCAIIAGATFVAWVLAGLSLLVGVPQMGISAVLLASFLLRSFYFVFGEVRWGGMTLGKRRVGLRVISRDGRPLSAEAVIARNLTRELELFVPLAAIFAPEELIGDVPGWARLLGLVWVFVFALMPLFNRDRLRCGDMVAGTLVVRAPAAVLLGDLAATGPAPRRSAPSQAARPDAELAFTSAQLDVYGIHELQVLEDLLRRHDQGVLEPRLLAEVAAKIQRKIGWPEDRRDVPVLEFLQAFYRAQRGRLEHKLLFGQRQERKRVG